MKNDYYSEQDKLDIMSLYSKLKSKTMNFCSKIKYTLRIMIDCSKCAETLFLHLQLLL